MINKDYIFRILKTFAQAVLSAFLVEVGAGVDFTDKVAVKTLILGLIAAGLSAVMNISNATVKEESEDEEDVN